MSESARYPALRTISKVYKILAIVAGISTVLVTLLFVVMPFLGTNIAWGVQAAALAALYGAFVTMTLMAVSEGIRLVIDIEANTRAVKDRAPAG